MQHYKSYELPIQRKPCTPFAFLSEEVCDLSMAYGLEYKKWGLTWLCNLKEKSKPRVGALTQMSSELTVCEAVDLAVLLCIQTTSISQILLNWPIKLGWWSWEHVVWNIPCVRQMYQFKCSLQNVFSHHTSSKKPVNGLAFQEKKPFSCFTS